MKKTTPSQAEWVTPLHYCPFTIFKYILNNTGHICLCETVNKHFPDCFKPLDRLFCNLVVNRIFIVQTCQSISISLIKCFNKLLHNFFWSHLYPAILTRLSGPSACKTGSTTRIRRFFP